MLRSTFTSRVLRAATTRSYHPSPYLFAYKDSQDRETLKPIPKENTVTGRDDDVAQSKVAFDPSVKSPEAQQEMARKEAEGEANPLEGSGSNQEMSKPRGDERSGLDRGPGEEVRKGGKSKKLSAEKKGDLRDRNVNDKPTG